MFHASRVCAFNNQVVSISKGSLVTKINSRHAICFCNVVVGRYIYSFFKAGAISDYKKGYRFGQADYSCFKVGAASNYNPITVLNGTPYLFQGIHTAQFQFQNTHFHQYSHH